MKRPRLLIAAGLCLTVAATVSAPQSSKKTSPPPRYTVSGRITGMAAGRHATVQVYAPGKPTHSATSHDDGTFLVRNILPGTYAVKPAHPMYLFDPHLRTVVITSHDVTDRDFTARPVPTKKR